MKMAKIARFVFWGTFVDYVTHLAEMYSRLQRMWEVGNFALLSAVINCRPLQYSSLYFWWSLVKPSMKSHC